MTADIAVATCPFCGGERPAHQPVCFTCATDNRIATVLNRATVGELRAGNTSGRFVTYEWTDDVYGRVVWNVSQALREVEAGNTFKLCDIPRSEQAYIVERCGWTPARVAEVDPSIPGIGAPLIYRGEGEPFITYILIDGTHRCVRAYQDGLPFAARLLTDDAAKRCILSAPPELLPW